jgi:hypothetical protein
MNTSESKASLVIILCEDRTTAAFARCLLHHYGLGNRDLRILYPDSEGGSGEAFVRRNYARTLLAYRRRRARATTILIAVIDADTGSVEKHRRELDIACRGEGVELRRPTDLVAHIVPRPEIEAWFAFLDGKMVDEDDMEVDYKRMGYDYRGREGEVAQWAQRLHDMCRAGELPSDAPASLRLACAEFDRVKDHLR